MTRAEHHPLCSIQRDGACDYDCARDYAPCMTPAELRTARARLGLTQHGLAKALRMGKNGWQSISRWEQDGNTVPGPAQVAIELLLASNPTLQP